MHAANMEIILRSYAHQDNYSFDRNLLCLVTKYCMLSIKVQNG